MSETFFNIKYEFDRSEVLRQIDNHLTKKDLSSYICVADGVVLSMVHRDGEYRKAVNGGMFTICDSSYVPLYLKLIYGIDRGQYCGSDIFSDIVGLKKYRQCFVGGTSAVLDALRRELSKTDPDVEDMMFLPLPFRAVEEFDYQDIASKIQSSGAEIVWVALGAPKQEKFASKLQSYLKSGVIIPVGAVFNFYSGTGIDRAPAWAVRCHLEFLYRIFREPKKQLRRCALILGTLPGVFLSEIKRKRNERHCSR